MSYQDNMNWLYAMFPYANSAHGATGIPTSVILAQWAHETAFGTSDVSHNANNLAGIKFVQGVSIASGQYGAYASYASLDQFVQDYARVMNLGIYSNVRAAGSPDATITALGQSPYAEDPSYGQLIKGIYDQYGVSGFDTYQGGTLAQKPSGVDNLSADDMKKYAAIGLAMVGVFALIKS